MPSNFEFKCSVIGKVSSVLEINCSQIPEEWWLLKPSCTQNLRPGTAIVWPSLQDLGFQSYWVNTFLKLSSHVCLFPVATATMKPHLPEAAHIHLQLWCTLGSVCLLSNCSQLTWVCPQLEAPLILPSLPIKACPGHPCPSGLSSSRSPEHAVLSKAKNEYLLTRFHSTE